MKFTQTLLISALLLCLPLQIFGQKSTPSNTALVNTYRHYQNENPSLNHLNYFENLAPAMKLAAPSKMVLTQVNDDPSGQKHYKYQQFHAGVPVFGSRYILHEKDGVVRSANGRFSPNVSVSTQPNVDARSALAFAQRDMQARAYAKESAEPSLCLIDPAFPEVSETLRLAYQIELSSTDPVDKRRYFVDAITGRIIKSYPLLLKEGVPSTAKTRYYGTQNIITDSIAPQAFVLRDLTRGEGIYIQNSEEDPFTNTSSTWNLTNANKDEVALDAHYCTQEYYDMMLSDYNWKGLDGNGKALTATVHAGDYANAFWDGESTSFGDGDCFYGPLTTLEVVGHEFTHGMIDYTSKLIYDMESGAINESLADIFGKILERKTDPANFSWDLGHSFITDPNAAPFRVMDDPTSIEMPALYRGLYWYTLNDVHTNSSIGNLWFTMIVDGKQGINEVGTAYDVPPIGIDKAGQIVFQVNKNYFTEGSTYQDFYTASIAVAASLYGPSSVEVLAVQEAWKAVGLPDPNASSVFDLGIPSNPFLPINHCGLGGYIPISFKIYNYGGIAYDPSSNGSVTLVSSTSLQYTVPLVNPIQPGAYVEILVDNWLQANQGGYLSVSTNLNVTDQEPFNNYATQYYNVSENAAHDLDLSASFSNPKCFDDEVNMNVYLGNNSCETLPEGTEMSFKIIDINGNEAWNSGPFLLPYDLGSNATAFVNFQIPLLSAPFKIEVDYPDDPNVSNNVSNQQPVQVIQPITGNYLNTFETNNGLDGFLLISNSTQQNTLQYQNSRFFASTGYDPYAENFQHCQDPFAVFNTPYHAGVNASIHSCLDFSATANPVVEFDLAQFRSAAANYEYSSMLNAIWTGATTGNYIFYGQPQGLVQHHSIQLPPYFKGDFDLKLYTELGHFDLNTINLNSDDFVLLDNLQFRKTTTATQQPNTETNAVFLSPNPAQEITTIQSSEGIRSILVQHANGQTLQNLQVNQPSYDLDLKGLKAGFYFLNIQLNDGNWVVKKLVKMD